MARYGIHPYSFRRHTRRHRRSGSPFKLASGAEMTKELTTTAEVAGSALAAGYLNGRFGAVEMMKVPLDLGTGLLLKVAAFLGFSGKAAPHLQNIGDGFLAAYATKLGAGLGAQARTKKGLPALSAATHRNAFDKATWTAGAESIFGSDPGPVTEAELNAMAYATR